ncbi:hypothetical protein ACQE3D_10810 [Methylomonas sp. MS20]|uniref:hypothetical protein n=1 Tax=unclassified Methylomonas TaxID=2608980 RepID=UPI0028A4B86B|nr:hypothetical protein [Methylomonas sp. MV1]MDT4328512.1 hypothetical protein [Methylomonas sp. MV1]
MKGKLILFGKLMLLWVFGISIWAFAHFAVADECKKLGGFYVGSKVFECHQVN